MVRNPLYVFDGLNSIGIFNVPLESTIQINNSDGNGTPKIIQLISKEGLTVVSTIADLLANSALYIDLNKETEIPSELEKITEGGKTGWRILGRNPENYGDIGQEAFDFSKAANVTLPTPVYGATGDYSFAEGYKTIASGWASHAEGLGTIAITKAGHAMGTYNIGTNVDNILEIGIGLGIGERKNALEVNKFGGLIAPELTIDLINSTGNQSLVTKEYSDYQLDSKFDKVGGVISGDVIINGSAPNSLSLINKGTAEFEYTEFKKNIKIGLNEAFNSEIKFTDANGTIHPNIYWDSSLQDFYVTDKFATGLQLWHAGNDGAGSGLDADKLQGIPGDEIASKDYVNNGLDSKFDKIGGIISGEVAIQNDLKVQGSTETNKLRVNLDSLFIGEVQLQDQLTVSGNAYIYGNAKVKEITGINGVIDVKSDMITKGIEAYGLLSANSGLLIAADANRNSGLAFTNLNIAGQQPEFYWSADTNKFMVKVSDNNSYEIYHAGNLPPVTGAVNFDELVDTPTTKVGNRGKYLRVAQNEQNIEYSDIDTTEFIDDASGSGDLDKTWSSSKLTSEFNNYVNKSGDTMNGYLSIGGYLSVVGELTAVNDAKILGTLEVDDIDSTKVTFTGDLEAVNIGASQTLLADREVKIGYNTGMGDHRSAVYFTDETSATLNPAIYWDNINREFRVDALNQGFTLYHSGNFSSANFAFLNAYNIFTDNNRFDGTVRTQKLESEAIELLPDPNYDAFLYTKEWDISDPTNPVLTNNEPRLYWSADPKGWFVSDYDNAGTFGTGKRIWHSGNFDPGTKLDTTGGTVQDLWVSNELTVDTTFNSNQLSKFNGDTYFTENVYIHHNSSLGTAGNLYVTNLFVEPDPQTSVGGDADITGNLNIHTDLIVDGNANIGGNISITGDLIVDGDITINGNINFTNLPTTDPGVQGQLWNDAGTLKISL